MSKKIDLLEDVEALSVDLGAISESVNKARKLENEIVGLEELIAQKKGELRVLAEESLPDLMQQFNIRQLTLADGTKIEVKLFISASIPSQGSIDKAKDDNQREALQLLQSQCFSWLRENGGEDLIKNNVEVRFGRDEDDACNKFTKNLQKSNVLYKRKVEVHPQSLNGFFKERLGEGKEVPMEMFRVFTGRRALIRR
tara:strand:- start:948 stop:1541 length:594 start_codon:yes stop_codon:yes gene_type:complete